MADKFPRKMNVGLLVPAETAIRKAVDEVETLGADERLTEAVMLLARAKDLVSDFIDEKIYD